MRRAVAGVCFVLGVVLHAVGIPAQGLPSHDVRGAGFAPAAYVHYLLALQYANDGIPYAALHEAASSLRIQSEKNPAAGLAFALIEEQRQDARIRLCCVAAKIVSMQYSPDGTRILTVLDDKTMRVWDAAAGQPMFAPMQHGGAVIAAGWSADGTRIVSSSDDGAVHLWDAATGKAMRAPFQLEKPLMHVAVSPHGERILGSQAGVVFLLDAKSGDVVTPKPAYHDDVSLVTFSNDGKYALIATNDDAADVVDATTAKRLHRLSVGNAVFSGSFSGDSRYALTGSEDHTARVWDANSGAAQGAGFSHMAAVSDAVFSRDAKMVLTTSYDHAARVWDAATGRALTPLLQHRGPVVQGAFSFDGTLAFTQSRDGETHVWDVATGEAAMLTVRDTGTVVNAAISPTEPELLIARDGVAEIRDLPPGEAAPAWLADLADFEASRSRLDRAGAANRSTIEKLQKSLLASKDADRWTQFGKWYFAAPGQRAVSPWSSISLQVYVSDLVRQDTKASLGYAKQIAAGHPDLLLRIAEKEKAKQ